MHVNKKSRNSLSNIFKQKDNATGYLDSGCTKHSGSETTPCTDKKENSGTIVKLPDQSKLTSTTEGLLLFDEKLLSERARTIKLFKEMDKTLLSVGQLCDDGCNVLFRAREARIMKNNKVILRARRNNVNGMYEVELPRPEPTEKLPQYKYHASQPGKQDYEVSTANNVYEIKTKKEIIKFLHKAAGSPVKSTWIQAIKNGQYTTWPGLTTKIVEKYLEKSQATVKGHMKQTRQNIRSTKNTQSAETTLNLHTEKTHHVYATIIDGKEEIYTDLTGAFPWKSSTGNQYIFVLYDFDSNNIITSPVKNRTKGEIKQAYEKLLGKLKSAGLKPKLQRMDNEASDILKDYIQSEKIDFQLVPPHNHRRNLAERAIQTFKDHFITILCSVNPDFPMHLWCKLLPQAELTLNLLRTSRINPKLSAYAQMHGQFDFNRTPLAIPGTKVIVHEKPSQRQSWGNRGVDGWYLGPAMEHYRCWNCYITETGAERSADVVEFFPHELKMPDTSSKDVIHRSALDLIEAIKNPHPKTVLEIGNQKMRALEELSEIFSQGTKPKNIPTLPPMPDKLHEICKTTYHVDAISEGGLKEKLHVPRNSEGENIGNSTEKSVNPEKKNWMPCITAHVISEDTGELLTHQKALKGKNGQTWIISTSNEWGRLMKGVGTRMKKGTETIFPIHRNKVPKDRKITYGKMVIDIRPEKVEKYRCRLTVGGDKIDYPYDTAAPTVDLETTKCHLNSTISTQNARYATGDLKDFYLNTPMKRYEYFKVHRRMLTDEIIRQYELEMYFDETDYIIFEVRKGMYGLPQAGKIAHDQLKEHLAKSGYQPCLFTPGLWKHKTRNISFVLWVDDFGIKYVKREDVEHLKEALEKLYKFTIDWDAQRYVGINLEWDYKNRQVSLSIPGYIDAVLLKLCNGRRHKKQDSPHPYNTPQYGKQTQIAPNIPETPEIDQNEMKLIERVIGNFLYYGRAVDNTMLVACNSIAVNKKYGMKKTLNAVSQLLDYAATHRDAKITYRASDMILKAHVDASYLSELEGKSRAAGYHFLGNKYAPGNEPDDEINGPVAVVVTVLKNVVSSAAEAEVGSVFVNLKDMAVHLRIILEDMGHPQPPTPVCVDNTTQCDWVNDRIKIRRSRAFDMRYYWIRDRVKQQQFYIYWKPGKKNLADYFSKHHPTWYHRKMRKLYLTPSTEVNSILKQSHWRGCIGNYPEISNKTQINPDGENGYNHKTVKTNARESTLKYRIDNNLRNKIRLPNKNINDSVSYSERFRWIRQIAHNLSIT